MREPGERRDIFLHKKKREKNEDFLCTYECWERKQCPRGRQWATASFMWGKRKHEAAGCLCMQDCTQWVFVILVLFYLIWLEVCMLCSTFMEHVEYSFNIDQGPRSLAGFFF